MWPVVRLELRLKTIVKGSQFKMRRKLFKYISGVILMVAVMSLSSCNHNNSSSGDTSFSSSAIEVTGVSLSSSETIIKVDDTLQLNVTISPLDATDKSVTYSSTDCVEVSSLGVVTGIKEGLATVTVTTHDGNFQDTVDLQVIPASENGYLNISDYVEKLDASPYAISDLSGKDKYGLSSSGNVGVDESLIVEKYPSLSDEEFAEDSIITTSEITLASIKTYFPEATETNSYYQIQTAIYLAKAVNDNGKMAKIKFPSGLVDVDSGLSTTGFAFVADGLNGTYFEGADTIINLKYASLNWKGYFNIKNSQNIHFNNITMRLDVPSSLTGTIIEGSVVDKSLTIKVDAEFNPLVERVLASSPKASIRSWVEFNYQTKAPLQGGNFLVDSFTSYEFTGDSANGYSLKVIFNSAISRPRNESFVAVSFSQYDAHGFTVQNSQGVYLENMTMNNAAGMALTASSVTNFYVNRFNLAIRENSASLMTATADAMHFVSMHGDVFVTNCLIENSHDDALNIKQGYWYKLADAEGGTTKSMTLARITSEVAQPNVGDKIAVYDEQTFASYNPTQGYYTIASVTKSGTGYVVTVNERMSNVSDWGVARVTFLSDTPNFVFANNIVRNKRNRGVLVQVPNATIENNAFINVGHGSIQAASAMDVYNEATLPQGLTIANNKFINNCYLKPEPLYGDISIFAISSNASVAPAETIHDITIENNYISHNGNASISMRGVGKDSIVKDNLFNDASTSQPSGDTFNCLVHLYNASDITLDGNYNNYTLDNGLSGIVLQGKTSESDINVLDNNYDIEFQKNTEAGPVVNVQAISTPLTIDGDLSDWNEAEVTPIEIDGISDAEGGKHTATELSDHFAINKLLITHDVSGIYFGFDIFDNEINVKTVNDFWLGDCIELFMSTITDMPNADMQVYKDDGGVIQAAFATRWETDNYTALSEVRTNSTYLAKKSLIQAKLVLTETGYRGEVCIPFTFAPEFKTAIDAGNPIDIAIVVADAERADLGLKRIQMSNVPHFVEDYKTKTARMPQYIFD